MARVVAKRIGRAIDEIETLKAARSAVYATTSHPDAMPVDIATGLDVVDRWPVSDSLAAVRSMLPQIEDRRTYDPSVEAPVRSLRRSTVRSIVPKANVAGRQASYAYGSIQFQAPAKVAICVRRKARRQVMFAKGKAGGRHRKPRRGPHSYIWC